MSTKVFDRFVRKAPFAVMTRILTQDFIGSDLHIVFDENREKQYGHLATFRAVAATVADVALNFSENFNQAYHEPDRSSALIRAPHERAVGGHKTILLTGRIGCHGEA